MGAYQIDTPIFYLSRLNTFANTNFYSAVWIISCPNKNVCFNPIPDAFMLPP